MQNIPASELPALPVLPGPAILLAAGLCFHYPGHELFANLSVRIPPGVTLLRGAEDRGKTTLLRLLAGELPAHAGALTVNTIRLGDQPMIYRQQVFWTHPQSSAFDQLTSADYFSAMRRLYPKFDDQLLGDLIEGLSLAQHLEKALYMLSTGSKRKVWLAAAFASGAAVTLLDEPFAALDKGSIGCVMELLQEAAAHPSRAWVVAGYEAPAEVPLAAIIDLGD
ncbi:MAG: ATP-binding cassette domain-containing protein [Burkholderiaceae bacterium]|nr:ATP-binding cassette domain-containing protein [Burkholderiaceae bacterium]